MTYARRQLKVRAIEALGRAARQFRTRHELWPLRVPREPVRLDEVLKQALGPDAALIDVQELRSRSLLQMDWAADDEVPSSRWEAWVLALPIGINLYCDSDDDETRLLASARRDAEGGEIDTFFLELLAESAGEHFGIGMSGGAPSRVRTSIANRDFLIEFFVDLFEVTHAEPSVHEALDRASIARPDPGNDGTDFRADVDQWLALTQR